MSSTRSVCVCAMAALALLEACTTTTRQCDKPAAAMSDTPGLTATLPRGCRLVQGEGPKIWSLVCDDGRQGLVVMGNGT